MRSAQFTFSRSCFLCACGTKMRSDPEPYIVCQQLWGLQKWKQTVRTGKSCCAIMCCAVTTQLACISACLHLRHKCTVQNRATSAPISAPPTAPAAIAAMLAFCGVTGWGASGLQAHRCCALKRQDVLACIRERCVVNLQVYA